METDPLLEADRWRAADELFRRALDLPAGERPGFAARCCGTDVGLRRMLEELLGATEGSGSFLEVPVEECCALPWDEIFPAPGTPAGHGGNDPPPDRTGERVGPYRLVRRIGRGGTSSVYLAERADGQFEQRVAVKLLRRGLDTEDIVRRFLAERQILSSLAHPNIARLLDGGATDDGLPYLVMEYIEGTPITRYCDGRRAGLGERLELFLDVCRAVQDAHRWLVVHRDLKPANIFVGADGHVKLLDFGIAKLLAPEGDAEATVAGARLLTPAYASPEQVRGDPITTASDIYQLGLLLCELLSGRLPYEVRALSPARAERAVMDAEPRPPSALLTDEAAAARSARRDELARSLRGDLDMIVLQALRKEPDARYSSAEALLEDVKRHLAGEPVRARPATLGYRARKFAGRHRTGVAVSAAGVLLLAGSALFATVQARRLAVERDRALAQEERAERVTEFLADIFEVTDPDEAGGENLTALELLERGATRAVSELQNQPRAQAEVLSTIGSMYIRRGLNDRAVPLLERAVELDRLPGGEPADLVRDLRRLASAAQPDARRAVAPLEEAAAVAERELGPNDPDLGAVLTDLAHNLFRVGDPPARERAIASLERALVILRAPRERDVRAELASALHLSGIGRGLDGLPRLEEALELRRSLYGDDHTAVAATLNDMGLVLEASDEAAADTLLERAAEINVRIHGPGHRQTLTILNNLAGRYRDRGDHARAEPLYREILRRRRIAYPDEPLGQAYTLHGLGWSLTELGRPGEAEPLLREVMRIVVASGCADPMLACHAVYQTGRSTLGRSLAAQGRYAEAEPLLLESYEWTASRPDAKIIPFMLDRLIDLYDDWGKPDRAAEYRALRPSAR